MLEFINAILQVIREDFFIGFGLISVLYPLFKLLPKNAFVTIVDRACCRFIVFLGVIYLSLWALVIIVTLITYNEADSAIALSRMFGAYWFGIWLQPLLWVGTTQLLRFPKFRFHRFCGY